MENFRLLPLLDINGIWHTAYFIGLSTIAAALILRRADRLPTPVKIFWMYAITRTLYVVEYPAPHAGPYTHSFQATASQALIEMLLIPLAAIQFGPTIKWLAAPLALFAASCVWFNYPGLMHAPSFNAALAALCVPLVPAWLVALIAVTALTHHGSTALLILLAQLAGLTLSTRRVPRIFLLGAAFVASASAAMFRGSFDSGGERLQHWMSYALYWAQDWKRVLVGAGPGSFVWYSIMTHPAQTGIYLQMHNDYLEIAWALGLVGVGLAAWALRSAIKRAWARPASLPGLLGCMAFMLTYSPIAYFPSTLLMTYFFTQALIIENVNV